MWQGKEHVEKKDWSRSLVAVAIDKDKGSQYAMKWALDHILTKGQTVVLIHIKSTKPQPSSVSLFPSGTGSFFQSNNSFGRSHNEAKDMFLPFRCFCTRKDVHCKDMILEEHDVAKALIDWVAQNGVDMLIMGAPKGGFLRFGKTDIPTLVTKGAPDFCTIYVISKGKISSTRSGSRSAPPSELRNEILSAQPSVISASSLCSSIGGRSIPGSDVSQRTSLSEESPDCNFRSPFTKGKYPHHVKTYAEISAESTDISFVCNSRPSVERSSFGTDQPNSNRCSVSTGGRLSTASSDFTEVESSMPSHRLSDNNIMSEIYPSSGPRYSTDTISDYFASSANRYSTDNSMYSVNRSDDSNGTWASSPYKYSDDVEAEMQRLRNELKQTMYNTAHQEALTAKQKALELRKWKLEEKKRLEEARLAKQTSVVAAAFLASDPEQSKETTTTKSKATIEAAERIAELEAQKRIPVEMEVLKGSGTSFGRTTTTTKRATPTDDDHEASTSTTTTLMKWKQNVVTTTTNYHKYKIEEIEAATEFFSQDLKIGEGGYGPVYKATLDQTPVAIKVLRPDAAQGRSQFQQEVEILSCIRHPNMVVLLGACPEYGCLVYEYMENGSLEERLFCKGGTPPLSWQDRFRIAAEISTGLLFLHQMKPEPLVHRDLKPGNILLDGEFVSKICDVGLARLVPPTVNDEVTQYRLTAAAGTFCYIDPEYQHTGMLGVKSDVYSLGVLLLQLITGKGPMGVAHQVQREIEKGSFEDVLDPSVTDWPVQEALDFAKIALGCAKLMRKDRPDLGSVVLPELNRLRVFAEQSK